MTRRAALVLLATLGACEPREERREEPRPAAAGAMPAVGIAVSDESGAWCAAFPSGALAPGDTVTLVAGPPEAPGVAAVVVARRAAPCPTAFPQPRWDGYATYDLRAPETAADAFVVLAVAGGVPWSRDAAGRLAADLDGDGAPEELRRCAADEGEHFTLWRRDPRTGARRRVAHEYFDWGVLVEHRCAAGEDGR